MYQLSAIQAIIINLMLLLLLLFFFFFFIDDEYECNVPLLDRAVLKATSSLNERGPENARLNGKLLLITLQSLPSSRSYAAGKIIFLFIIFIQ